SSYVLTKGPLLDGANGACTVGPAGASCGRCHGRCRRDSSSDNAGQPAQNDSTTSHARLPPLYAYLLRYIDTWRLMQTPPRDVALMRCAAIPKIIDLERNQVSHSSPGF